MHGMFVAPEMAKEAWEAVKAEKESKELIEETTEERLGFQSEPLPEMTEKIRGRREDSPTTGAPESLADLAKKYKDGS